MNMMTVTDPSVVLNRLTAVVHLIQIPDIRHTNVLKTQKQRSDKPSDS